MEQKNIVATLYLKEGKAVRSMTDFTPVDDVYQLCQLYNDSGIDKIIIFDLSTSDDEHEKNINTIKNINRNIEIKVCAGGNINRLEDVKKLLYAGCLQVIFNASKPSSVGLAKEASERFGKDRILVSVNNVDFIFKNQQSIEDTFHEVLVLNADILDALENLTNVPYVVNLSEYNYEEIVRLLKREKIRGIAGTFINNSKMPRHSCCEVRVMQLHDILLLRTSASLHSVSVGAKPLSTGQCAPCRRLYQLGD